MQRNPTVELPLPVDEILKCDAIILTHTHEDYWDAHARRVVPKDKLIFVEWATLSSARSGTRASRTSA